MIKIIILRVFVAAVIIGSTHAGLANDTAARVAAGGITFVKSEHIRMLEEVLEVSLSMVRVKYRLLNESDQDIHTTVAFPMPPYRWNSGESMWDMNQRPVTTFKAFVNGRQISNATTIKAIIGGRDVTWRLREIGLSDAEIQVGAGCHVTQTGTIVYDLTQHQKEMVMQLTGEKEACPSWTVASTLFWEQTFPAQKEVVVEHQYAPFVGIGYSAPYQQPHGYVTDIPAVEGETDKNRACLSSSTRKAIDKRIKAFVDGGEKLVYVTLHDVEYVLGTGRNWKGPIGKFTLRITKDSPDQFIALCFQGKPTKVNSNVYEFVQKGFVPQDRLVVYFYTVATKPYYRKAKSE